MLVWHAAAAVDPDLPWRSIESEHFQVHFAAPNQSAAERTIVIAERVHQRLAQELQWSPAEKTHLVFSDESDYANGFATVFNINRSVLFMAPPTGVGGLEDFDNWLDLLITHEYTHVLHLDKAAGAPLIMRGVFGRFLLLFPNVFEPSWIIEGLATYKETDIERGIGRGQSSLFAMMMRMETEQGIKPVSQVNLPISTWPAGATRYLYGVYFMRFVADRYGEDKLQQFINEYSDNILPFFLNTTFKKIFDKDLTAMWQEYELWLEEKFQPQIAALQQQTGVNEALAITTDGYVNQPVRAQGDNLYYIRSDGSYQPELVRRAANGDVKILTEVHGNAGFDLNAHGDIIIAQPEVCDEFNLYSDLYLYAKAGLRRISHCGRYQRAVWNARGDGLIAVHHQAGVFELRELDINGEQKQLLWKSSDDEVLSQIDASNDGRHLVAAIWRKTHGWNLEVFDLETRTWTALTQNSDIQAYPEYSADGLSLFYSSDADGVYNLYRYDIASGQHHQLSHLLGGGFQSSQGVAGGPLYYIGYSARGTDVYMLLDAEKQNPVDLNVTPGLSPEIFAKKDFVSKDYSPWQSLAPRWWFPYFILDPERSEVGFTTAGNDALGIHNYALTAAYDFKNTAPLGSAVYQYSNSFVFSLSRDNNLYKNSSGVIERLRADETLQLVYAVPDTELLSASNILLALSWERDRDIELRNGATPVADRHDNLAGLAWLYNNARRYPFSISRNDGRRLRLVAEDGDSFDSDFSGQVYTLDWREYLRLGGEHVLSLRLLQGWGTQQPSRFSLGGEDNGSSLSPFLETSGEGVFARRQYPLRGYDEGLPQLRGRRAQLLSAEYRFPIQRVERGIMAPPLGLMQWYGNIFVDTGAAYDGRRPDTYYTGAGVEVSADLDVFYLLPLTLRLGYAHGFDEVLGDNRAYLSLGASF
jgi:hypothetical protein